METYEPRYPVEHPLPHDPILHEAQFTADEACAVSGLTAGQLKGILDRKQIVMSFSHNPGTGRRRMFTGRDILLLSVSKMASGIGFPLGFVDLLADQVVSHADQIVIENALGEATPPLVIAVYPIEGDDWAITPFAGVGVDTRKLPPVFMAFDLSRIVIETLSALSGIVAKEAE